MSQKEPEPKKEEPIEEPKEEPTQEPKIEPKPTKEEEGEEGKEEGRQPITTKQIELTNEGEMPTLSPQIPSSTDNILLGASILIILMALIGIGLFLFKIFSKEGEEIE